MGGIGVFWLLSTSAQLFSKYEVWYSYTGFLAITLPCPDMQYRGLVDEVFPGLQSVDQLLHRFRVAIEIWAGTNPDRPCVDMYHRTIVAGSAIMPRWARWRLTDIGTEPTNWIWARRGEFAGVYDLLAPAANPMVARL
jgi:hypothetical protein